MSIWADLRQMPKDPPDWEDKASVAAWIGHVRTVAFLAGARHDEIDKAEAEQLMAALKSKDAANG